MVSLASVAVQSVVKRVCVLGVKCGGSYRLALDVRIENHQLHPVYEGRNADLTSQNSSPIHDHNMYATVNRNPPESEEMSSLTFIDRDFQIILCLKIKLPEKAPISTQLQPKSFCVEMKLTSSMSLC